METRTRAPVSKWYSRFVQMMKVLLPVVAALLIILILVWPYLRSEDLRFRLSFAALTANQNEDPSMVNPRFLGIDKENKAYSITADLARNLAAGTSSVELEMPKADITLDDGTWLVLTAKTGIFRRAKKTLDLTGAVNLFHDSGYEFKTSKAVIDLQKGVASGSEAVRGHGPFSEIQGEGFRLFDKGKTIIFTGKSKLVIFPGLGKSAK
jgi:lipopolysaccharide export system protein LptC